MSNLWWFVRFFGLLALFFGFIYYIDYHLACNPEGTTAAKINWAGHNTCKK